MTNRLLFCIKAMFGIFTTQELTSIDCTFTSVCANVIFYINLSCGIDVDTNLILI